MSSSATTSRRPKKVFLRYGRESLEVKCLKDGTLDVDIETGEVFSVRYGKRFKRKLEKDEDGYWKFGLNRERKAKRGKPVNERRSNGKTYFRYRSRRTVFVHRLVKIKALAIAKGGRNWQQYVKDLPIGIDVNHLSGKDNNNHLQLELQTELANRTRTEMSDADYAALQEAF